MFSLRDKKNYFLIIRNTPSYHQYVFSTFWPRDKKLSLYGKQKQDGLDISQKGWHYQTIQYQKHQNTQLSELWLKKKTYSI